MDNSIGIVILAAGMGKRMKSDKAKVLHEVAGRPMIDYIVDVAADVAGSNVVVVVGHQAAKVQEVIGRSHQVRFAFQSEQRGTGHAVACAMTEVPDGVDSVVVLCGDVPLIRSATIRQMAADHRVHNRDVTVLAVRVSDPTGYGRMIMDADGQLTAIVEQADANEAQLKIDVINTGFYVIDKSFLMFALPLLDCDNAQNEVYLTDIVSLGHRHHRNIGAMMGSDPDEILGVNSQTELQLAEKLMIMRSRESAGER